MLRAEVQLKAQQQKLIVVRNDLEEQKFTVARAIGLPESQRLRLTDQEVDSRAAPLPLPDALAEAFEWRADYQAAQARLRAAELSRKALDRERLPSISFHAD